MPVVIIEPKEFWLFQYPQRIEVGATLPTPLPAKVNFSFQYPQTGRAQYNI